MSLKQIEKEEHKERKKEGRKPKECKKPDGKKDRQTDKRKIIILSVLEHGMSDIMVSPVVAVMRSRRWRQSRLKFFVDQFRLFLYKGNVSQKVLCFSCVNITSTMCQTKSSTRIRLHVE